MSSNSFIMTRKITLIPVVPDNNGWRKRFDKYVDKAYEDVQEQIVDVQNNLSDQQLTKQRKSSLEKWLVSLKKKADMYEDYISGGEITRSLLNDYAYTFVRNACKEESRHKNLVISKVIDTLRINGYYDLRTEEAKELFRQTFNESMRLKDGNFSDIINNPCGGYGHAWSNALRSSLIKDIMNGCISCRNGQARNFKEQSGFTITSAAMGFSHGYESDDLLYANMDEKDAPIYFDFGGSGKPSLLQFRMNLGVNPKTKKELVSTIKKVYSGEYQTGGSTIQISQNKIILNLTMKIPKAKDLLDNLDKDTVLGLSLGLNTAIIGALNDGKSYFTFGTETELEYYRSYIQENFRDLQKAIRNTTGGHGRKKKLKKLEIFRAREQQYVKTFNHKASRAAVDFAIKNKAGIIKMPNLTELGNKRKDGNVEINYLLRNWSYYALQQMIEYKAARVGITVEYVPFPDAEKGVADLEMAKQIANM